MPKQSIPCPACQKGRIYFTPSSWRILNNPEVSIIVMTHEKSINCNKCDRWMAPCFDMAMIGQVGIPTAWVEVPKPEPESDLVLVKPADIKLT